MVFLMVSNRRWQSNKLPLSNYSGNVGAVCWNVSHESTWVLDMWSKIRGCLGVDE